MHILLDTNIYLADLTFRKPEHEALRNYLQTSHGSIVMPRIVKDEVGKNIKSQAQTEISKLRQLHSVVLGAITSTPDPERLEELIQEEFDRGLRRNRVQAVDYGDTSLETIVERSLSETPPFKSKGRGFRDTLIWYSLLQYLRVNPTAEVAFVTDNSRDFGEGALLPELLAELTDLGFLHRVSYYNSLNEFLAEHSQPIAFINDEFVEISVREDMDAFADSVDEDDLDIDYPSREVDWNVIDIDYEEGLIESYYIYRTTDTHYYLYVEASLHYYVGLEGYDYDWGYDEMNGVWGHHMRHVQDNATAFYTCEIEIKIDKLTHDVEVIG